MLMPVVQGGATSTINISILTNTAETNILTLAQAAGYNAAIDDSPIVVTIAAGVTVSGSSTYALRTGALHANSDLTINIQGSVDGFTGAVGQSIGAAGSPGGDAVFFETATGGIGIYTINVASGANLRSGGGGGGAGGSAGIAGTYRPPEGEEPGYCTTPNYTGINGANGTSSVGQAGTAGANGTYGSGSVNCIVTAIGAGGAGGAAGFAVRKNGRTVTVNNSGTVAGTIG